MMQASVKYRALRRPPPGRAILCSLAMFAGVVAWRGVPACWRLLDPELQITPLAGQEFEVNPQAVDPWGRPLRSHINQLAFLARGSWRPALYEWRDPLVPLSSVAPTYARVYSCGPNGVDEFGMCGADAHGGPYDDIFLLDPADPKLVLFRESGRLAAIVTLALGGMIVAVTCRQGSGRLHLLAGAVCTASLCVITISVHHAWALVERPPWSLISVVGTSVIGGLIVWVGVLTPRRGSQGHEPTSGRVEAKM